MRIIIFLIVIFNNASLLAQSNDTHLMGSGSKQVSGPGVNQDKTKYDRTKSKSREELKKEEIGNNTTSTDTIEGKNSRKISD